MFHCLDLVYANGKFPSCVVGRDLCVAAEGLMVELIKLDLGPGVLDLTKLDDLLNQTRVAMMESVPGALDRVALRALF